jgi:TonB family protein
VIASLIDVTLGLALVLLLRRPARRVSGAGPAFVLWLLPPAMAVVSWLPELDPRWQVVPPMLVHDMSRLGVGAAHVAASHGVAWLAVWAGGAALALLRLLASYLRLARQCRPLPGALAEATRDLLPPGDRSRLRLHPSGPAVLWAPRSRILLPADLLQHFDPSQRAMVLAHELTHIRRGDALWNLLAELVGAVLWFHPLVWLARPRFRIDQELACDERLLRTPDSDEAAYARALMQSSERANAPALTPWLCQPQLKERLMMIRRQRASGLRRGMGYVLIALVVATGAATVQAAAGGTPASQELAFTARAQPRYPKDAILRKEQGTVVLIIAVSPDGSVKSVNNDPGASTTTSASLIATASQAALQWHFQPIIRNGKAVEGWARVPVSFSLDER